MARVLVEQRCARRAASRDRTGAISGPASTRRSPSTSRLRSCDRGARYRFAVGESRADQRASSPTSCSTGAAAIPSSLSRIRWRRMTMRACARSRRAPASHVQVIGDDYLVTSAGRISAAAAAGACNAVLLKPNQAGTITETKAALRRRARRRLVDDRVGALGRNRRCDDRPSRGRLGRRSVEGRLLRALRAHGQVERGAAHRRSARSAAILGGCLSEPLWTKSTF